MLPAIEEVVKWYSLPSVPSALPSHLRISLARAPWRHFNLTKLVCLSLH